MSAELSAAPSAPGTSVLIVGSGPVGLTLSLELSRYGIEHMLISEAGGPSTHPKCNTTTSRSMEHFRRIGVSKALRFGGLDEDYPTDIAYFTRLGVLEIGRIRFPSAREAAQRLGKENGVWQTPELQHRISQVFMEPILLDEARAKAQANIQLGHRLLGYSDRDSEEVVASVESLETGRVHEVRCRWLVGCDGGRSMVRKTAGIAFEGEDSADRPMFGGTMVATYYRSHRLAQLLKGREGLMYWTVNSEIRSVTVAIDGKNRFLTHVQVPRGVDPNSLKPADVLNRIAGAPIDVEVLSSAIWNAGFSLVAQRLVKGRAILAGDAAHLITPTGGLGMNTGIDDVSNLAWKLAGEIKGWGGPALVESYDRERRPVGIRNTRIASDIADALGKFPVPDAIERSDQESHAARAQVIEAIEQVKVKEFGTVGAQLGVRYEGSPIIVSDGTPPSPDSPSVYVPTARPGSRLPHFFLSDGSSLFDKLGIHFTLLDLSNNQSQAEALLKSGRSRGIELKHLPIDSKYRTEFDATYVLVRPDTHVGWRGDQLPTDATGLFNTLLGWNV
jgi:2-polyprenyl-6-methoxyphenol hydroxylase-like FAD-dependent oxidoreductase